MPKNKQPNPSTSRTRRRPVYKHPIFIATIAIFVLAGAGFAIVHFAKNPAVSQSNPKASTSQSSDKPNSTQSSAESKEEPAKEAPAENAPSNSSVSPDGKTPVKYDGTDPNQDASLTGYVTTARFIGDKLTIRVNIDQYLSSGTCTLTLSDGTSQLNKTASLVPSAATSTCEGFDIPISELSSFSRPINININLSSGDKTGVISGVTEQ